MAKVKIRVKPSSKEESLSFEGGVLVARVKEPAREGRANRALVSLLAKRLGVPKGAIKILAGARSRDKVVEVEGLGLDEIQRRLF